MTTQQLEMAIAETYHPSVTSRAQAVLDKALRLSARERARVASELLASIEGKTDADAEAAWSKEITRRAKRAIAGESVGTDWATVRDRLKKSSTKRR